MVLLNGLGLAMIHRIDLAKDEATAPEQLTWTAVGVLLFVAVLLVIWDHRRLQAFTYTAGLLGLVLLMLPLIPGLGVVRNGSRIWINSSAPSFQPGEVAKLCLVVFFAGYLAVKRDALAPRRAPRFLGIDLPRARDLGPIGVA